eukprot:CFRG4796T1
MVFLFKPSAVLALTISLFDMAVAQMPFSPSMDALQNLPCSEKLPRILLREGDYEDCAALYESTSEAVKNCQTELKGLVAKTGAAMKDEQCKTDVIQFFHEKIMNVNVNPIVDAVSALEDCGKDESKSYEDCILQLWTDIRGDYHSIGQELVQGLDKNSMDKLMKLGDAANDLYSCVRTALPLKDAIKDDKKWADSLKQVENVLEEFRKMIGTVADLLTDDTQSVLKVFYQISEGNTKSSEDSNEGDSEPVQLSQVLPRLIPTDVVDARLCNKQWESFVREMLSVSTNEEVLSSFHVMTEHMYFLGNARRWLWEAMNEERLRNLARQLNCAFTWEDSSSIGDCLTKVAEAIHTFEYNVENTEALSKIKPNTHHKLSTTGGSSEDDQYIARRFIIVVGTCLCLFVVCPLAYIGVGILAKHRKPYFNLFQSAPEDSLMMVNSDEDDSDDDLKL